MIGMPLRLAANLRVVVGLICMTFILLIYGKLNRVSLWPPAAQAHITTAIVALLLYFEGLRLTRASTAGYFEMMQTLAAVCITWGFFHAALHWHQVIAGIVLMAAVAMVQRAQAAVETSPIEGDFVR